MLPHHVLIDEREIQARLDQMAKSIAHDAGDRPLLLLGLLTGSFMVVADLARALARHGAEPQVSFLRVSHYGARTDASRSVSLEEPVSADLSGLAVLVVDDILESGVSMAAVVERLRAGAPAWLRICTLLDKPGKRRAPIEADYVGFTVPDRWLIGYGLDLGGEGRALPYVGVVEREEEVKP